MIKYNGDQKKSDLQKYNWPIKHNQMFNFPSLNLFRLCIEKLVITIRLISDYRHM